MNGEPRLTHIVDENESATRGNYVEIAPHVKELIAYARANPTTRFDVVRIGCGLAGYQDTDIAPLFAGSPLNVHLPNGWRAILAELERAQIQEGCEKAVTLIKAGARGIIRV